MATRPCEVCSKATSKYKCPSCYIPYCSLACFKTHKETPCMKPEAPIEKPRIDEEKTMKRPLTVDNPSELVSQEQLKSVAACREIRAALSNEQLQSLICKIDSSEDAENELDKAMEGDVFRIFADKIFSAINP